MSQQQQNTPQVSTLANVGRLLGAIGIVLWASVPLTWLLTAEIGPLVIAKLVLGTLAVGFYLSTNRDIFDRAVGSRSLGLMVLTSLSSLLVIGVVASLNYVAIENPREWDMTREGIFTLSEQTEKVLARLDTEVKIQVFYGPADGMGAVSDEILTRYTERTNYLTYEIIDPQSRPDLTELYQLTEQGPRIVFLARDQEARAKDLTEEQLTNAIVKVAEQTQKTVHYLTGHGELAMDDVENAEGGQALADAIRAEGYSLEPLSLLNAAGPAPRGKVDVKDAQLVDKLAIPDNVMFLLICGPRSPLLGPEVAAVRAFLDRGGRAIIMLEPSSDGGLAPVLSDFRVEARFDMIVDASPLSRQLMLGPAAPVVVPTDLVHPITEKLTVVGVMMTARTLSTRGDRGAVTVSPILSAGESAWGETNLDEGLAEHDERDNMDTTVAMVATRTLGQPDASKLSDEARLVVFGDSDWVTNKYHGMQGNGDIALNTINWLAEEEDRISIRPKTRQASRLSLVGEDLGYLKFFSMDIIPVFLVAMGLGIVLIRRQR